MDIDMIRGDTLSIQFEIEADEPINYASEDFNVTFSVKQAATDNAYVFQKHKAAVTEIAENTFILRIAPEDTQDLIPGYYYYDLQLNIGSDVYTIALGYLQIIRDITLPSGILPAFIYPDINGNGEVDRVDAVLITQAYSNIQAGRPSGLTPEQEDMADCNRNGVIDSNDASLVLKFVSDFEAGKYTNDIAGWNEFMALHYSLQG